MARLIPPHLDVRRTPSPGEREVFERLDGDQASDGWLVLHSLNLAKHGSKVKSEADFVFLVPDLGILCLEIKAHRSVSVRDGMWHLGSQKPRSESPFEQADTASRSIMSCLSRAPNLKHVYVGSGVLFTHANFDQLSIEWSQWEYADRRAFRSRPTSQIVRSILQASIAHAQEVHPRMGTAGLSKEQADQALSLLRPDFEMVLSPKQLRADSDQELLRLTEEQFTALDYLSQAPQVVFAGPAGTGKTVLALESVRREAQQGKRVLMLCFNTLLARMLSDSLGDLRSEVFVGTMHKFMMQLTDSEGPLSNEDFANLPELALEAALGDVEPYDVLVVDEAQDLLRGDFLDVLDCTLRGGLASGRWRLFGDFTAQSVHSSTTDVSVARFVSERCPMSASFNLTKNCRNVPRVVDYVERLAPIHEETEVLRSDNEIRPRVKFTSSAEAHGALIGYLQEARDQGFPWHDIIILSPFAESSTVDAARQLEPWSSRIGDVRHRHRGQIGHTSIRKFKGLDAPAVILVDIDDITSSDAQSLLYVGITRARDGLWLLLDNRCKDEMNQILFGKRTPK